MFLVDSHVHLDVPEFDLDRECVLARARAVGVGLQIVPAITREGWESLRDLCARHADLVPAYGLHPMYLDRHRPQHLEALELWIQRERPAAIGECGLDFFVRDLDRDAQLAYFERHLQLAKRFDLPLIVHARRALDEVTAAVRRVGGVRGIVHSFGGSFEQARQLWRLGWMIGVGGPVTYARATRLRRLVTEMPLEFLVLETDAPDQPTADRRGQRNEPAQLLAVAREVAQLRRVPESEVAHATSANVFRLLNRPLPVVGA